MKRKKNDQSALHTPGIEFILEEMSKLNVVKIAWFNIYVIQKKNLHFTSQPTSVTSTLNEERIQDLNFLNLKGEQDKFSSKIEEIFHSN